MAFLNVCVGAVAHGGDWLGRAASREVALTGEGMLHTTNARWRGALHGILSANDALRMVRPLLGLEKTRVHVVKATVVLGSVPRQGMPRREALREKE